MKKSSEKSMESFRRPDPMASFGPSLMRLMRLLGALPSFTLAGLFLATWVTPDALGPKMVSHLVLLLAMEFLNVHAAGFLGVVYLSNLTRAKKILALLGLSLMYSVFVGGFSLMFRAWWPVAVFWALIAFRLALILLGRRPDEQDRTRMIVSWVAGGVLYLTCNLIAVAVPLPPLGITPEVIARQEWSGSGLWFEAPQKVMAAGFLYYGLVSVFGLLLDRWIGRSNSKKR